MIFHTQKIQGFSLVEVLVAITILLLVIVGPMQIISRSINSTNFATEQVNAWFLAQEGLELAQKGRDDLVLQNFSYQLNPATGEDTPLTEFLNYYTNCVGSSGACGLNIGNGVSLPTRVNCNVLNNCRLYLDSTNDRSSYTHTITGTPSLYTRVIKMEPTLVGGLGSKVREIKVTSTVTWRTGSLINSQKVEAITYLFNVYDTD